MAEYYDVDRITNDQTGDVFHLKDYSLSSAVSSPAPIVSFQDGAPYPMSLQFAIEPVQEGEGDPNPSSNVRPITGWTGANVRTAGKNLFPIVLESGSSSAFVWTVNNDGTITFSGTPTNNPTIVVYDFPISSDLGTIILSGLGNSVVNIVWNNVYLYDADGNSLAPAYKNSNDDVTIDLTEYPTIARIVASVKRSANNVECSGTMKPMVRFASITDGTWEQYKGAVYPITFPETTYGGTMTVNADGTGELIVDTAFYEFDGSEDESWSISTSSTNRYRFGSIVVTAYNANERLNAIGSSLPCVSITLAGSEIGFGLSANNAIRIRYGLFETLTVSELKTYLSQNPLQVAYKINNPQTVSLSPGLVKSILGQNHVWTDTGNILSLSYVTDNVPELIRQDTEGQIGSIMRTMIAPVLDSMVADTALSVNDFRIVDGVLYIVTAPIASGGTLTIGTNVNKTSIGEQITALLNAN